MGPIDPEAHRQAEAEVFKGLWIYIVTLLFLTTVAWCVVGIRGHILHEPYPHNTLLFDPKVRFTDFTDLSVRVAHFGEPNMLSRRDIVNPYSYPTPSIYAFLFFVRLFPNPVLAYLLFAILSFLIAACGLSLRVYRTSPRILPQAAVWSTLLFGFPLLFLLDRGNIEAVLWVLILLGLVAYIRNWTLTSAILWSLAASMKIFPALLFMLFLAKRKYRIFAIAIAATAAFTVLALVGVGPTFRQAVSDSAKTAPFVINNYILARTDPGFDHSLFASTKQVIYLCRVSFTGHQDPQQTRPAFEIALRLYNLLVLLGGVLIYWFRLRRMPLLNQFMASMLLSILLPYVSNEYTLVYVYLVWGAFLLFLLTDVATGRVRIPARAIQVILFSCAVTFSPLTYLEVGHRFGFGHGVLFGGQVKTVFLALIFLTVLWVPMPSSLFRDLQIPTGLAVADDWSNSVAKAP